MSLAYIERDWPECGLFESMEFTLSYRGPLPSSQKKGGEKKKEIQYGMREAFRTQIANRWQNLPYLKDRELSCHPFPRTEMTL
jgi:hypothetical protein